MNPSDLVNAIVGNNPTAVHQNLMNMGVVGQQFAVTPQSFTELLSSLPDDIIPNRQHATNFVANALNVPIDNNGVAAGNLQATLNRYNLPVKDVVYKIFENHMPTAAKQEAVSTPGCSCGGAYGQGMNAVRNTLLVLAFLGFVFVILLFVKLILKII